LSRLLEAGLSWQQFVDEVNPTTSAETKVCLTYLFLHSFIILAYLISYFASRSAIAALLVCRSAALISVLLFFLVSFSADFRHTSVGFVF